MMFARLLNACHHFPGFVYAAVRLIAATNTIEVDVRPRRGLQGALFVLRQDRGRI
jgi:transposase